MRCLCGHGGDRLFHSPVNMFTSNPRRSGPDFPHPGGVNNVIFFPERGWVQAMPSPGKDQVTVRTENRVYFVTPRHSALGNLR